MVKNGPEKTCNYQLALSALHLKAVGEASVVSTLARSRSSSFSYPRNLLCKSKFVCVAVSVTSLLPRNEQADVRLSISFDRNQVRRTKWVFDKDEERIDPFVRGLPDELAFSL